MFNGNCREVMEFYQACLGGELILDRAGDAPASANIPPGVREQIMHATLAKGDMIVMASDTLEPGDMKNGNSVYLCIHEGTKEETEKQFTKLAEGGTITQPLQEVFFGLHGELIDKFGIRWMFQATMPKEKRE